MQHSCFKLFVFFSFTAFTKVECLPDAVSNDCQRDFGTEQQIPTNRLCYITRVLYFQEPTSFPLRTDGELLCRRHGYEGLARFLGRESAKNAEVTIFRAFKSRGKHFQEI